MSKRTISSETKLVGLIGWPVGHSVSPAMHNAAFAALGLDWRYVGLAVAPEPAARINEAVRGLRALGFRGANVTVPHKQAVMAALDDLSPAAEAIGAVNTICVEADGTLRGDNTDARGFIADLRDHGVDPAGATALVLGAGGSARAAVYGLAEAGCSAIAVLNRTAAKAHALAEVMQPRFHDCVISGGDIGQELAEHAGADLVVNCTSLGMAPHTDGTPWDEGIAFHRRQTVYDLVYNPPETRLLAKANTDGARAIGGLGMLVWQGALAFRLWTGKEAPVAIMREAAIGTFRGWTGASKT